MGVSAADVGLRDDVKAGWFNADTRELAPGFAISPRDVVVDVGAGRGGMSLFCARYAARTILVEPDAASLARTVADLRGREPVNVEGTPGDVMRLPLQDDIADKVVCAEVLEHVDDPAAAMAELVRVGRPGALYLLSIPGVVSERLQIGIAPPWYFAKPNHVRIFEPDEFDRLVTEAGLVIERRGARSIFWTLWWLFAWQTEAEAGGTTPLLDAWTLTWSKVLDAPNGPHLKAALDALAPKSAYIVARKPLRLTES